jgi:hypothetical protein
MDPFQWDLYTERRYPQFSTAGRRARRGSLPCVAVRGWTLQRDRYTLC